MSKPHPPHWIGCPTRASGTASEAAAGTYLPSPLRTTAAHRAGWLRFRTFPPRGSFPAFVPMPRAAKTASDTLL
jgi:hypothetical protein